MKIATGVLAAIVVAGIGWAGSAHAQGAPQGSYLRSCTNVSAGGDTLSASCRRADGREDRSTLSGFRRCVGDIGNSNGVLQCSVAGGAQLRGQVVAGEAPRGEPPRGEPPRGGPGGPPFGEPPRGGPGFGGPPGGPPGGGDWRERCEHLRHDADELRDRIQREFNPIERGRLEARLRDMQAERERCR